MKKSRKAKVFYTLLNAAGKEVQIDLNNYKVTCTITGNRKGFYHKYLANLIEKKFDNNIDTFRTTYVSREAGPSKAERQADKLQARINRLRNQIKELEAKQKELVVN